MNFLTFGCLAHKGPPYAAFYYSAFDLWMSCSQGSTISRLLLFNFRSLDVLPARVHHRSHLIIQFLSFGCVARKGPQKVAFIVRELINPPEEFIASCLNYLIHPFASCRSFHYNAAPIFFLGLSIYGCLFRRAL